MSQNRDNLDWSVFENKSRLIRIINFNSKNMYIFNNSKLSSEHSYEIVSDGGFGLIVDGYKSLFGNPTDVNVNNISPVARSNFFEFRRTCQFYTIKNVQILNSKNDTFNIPLFNVRGSSRNFIFENILCDGCSGNYAMIDYGNNSTDGYCILNNIFLMKRNANDKIYNIGSDNLGERTNCLLLPT